MLVMHKLLAVFTTVALQMICKCNINSGQKRLDGVPRKVSSRLCQSRGLPAGTPNFDGG